MKVETATTQGRSADGGTSRYSPLEILPILLSLGFAALALRPLGDPDVWWHLRTGELIAESGFVSSDPWSDASTQPWLLHEWAAELLMYLAHSVAPYHGVIALHAVGMLVLAVLVAHSCRREAGPVITSLVSVIALSALFVRTAERPQLASWCLLAATIPALRRSVSARRAPVWFIPVLWAWANVHGLWAGALALYASLVLGLVIDEGVRNWREYSRFVLVGLAGVVAVGLTPNGPTLLLAPLEVREYAQFVAEWTPPSLARPFNVGATILVGIVVVGWARHHIRSSLPDVTLFLASVLLGLSYSRTVPIAVIVLAPMAAASLQALRRRPVPAVHPNRRQRALTVTTVAASVLAASFWLPSVPPVKQGAPWEVSTLLDRLPGRAHVLNEYEWGGWLLWAARDVSPGIDGRTEIYSVEYVRDYTRSLGLGPGWSNFIDDQDFDAAWLRRESPLVLGLATEGWRTAFRNDYSVVLLPPE